MNATFVNPAAIAAVPAAQPSAAPPSAAPALGQADFLKLLTAQLSAQDPFNPIDNTQMVAQMAQFSQVSGIAEMNRSLSSIASLLQSRGAADTAGWIGRAALVTSDVIAPLPDGTIAGEVQIDEPADDLVIQFVDANGTVVHSERMGRQASGPVSFAWNSADAGNGATGQPVRVLVSDGTTPLTPTVRGWTQITGIMSPAAGVNSRLLTPLGPIEADAILQLS